MDVGVGWSGSLATSDGSAWHGLRATWRPGPGASWAIGEANYGVHRADDPDELFRRRRQRSR